MSYPHSGLPAYLWQAMLHSFLIAAVFYAWAQNVRLGSGPAKRWALGFILVLPLLTAAIPGRDGADFREGSAWLDSLRLLMIPLPFVGSVFRIVLIVAAATTVMTVVQEIGPLLRRVRRHSGPVPADLAAQVRALPGWERCEILVPEDPHLEVATAGRPGRPRLIVTRGALAALTEEELEVVLRHENAHWRSGRWALTHLLFVVRMLQCYNPVALWAFREHCIEMEVACDAAAVTERDAGPLARGLLKVYDGTSRGDVTERAGIRKRVDVLLGRGEPTTDIPATTVVAAGVLLAGLLPWVV